MDSKIDQEAQHVHHFKEEKVGTNILNSKKHSTSQMSELLDYNVQLSDLQNKFSSVFEETSDKKRLLENMEERKVEKRFDFPLLEFL